MTELIIGTDWGAYLNWDERIQFNWEELYDKAHVRFAVFRGDQEQISSIYGNYSTFRNLEASRRVLPVNASYYWHYPDGGIQYYIDRYSRAIDREQPDFIGVDIEQTKVWNGSAEVQVDPNKMSDTAQGLCEGLSARYPEKQLVIYTRKDIITYYSPPMAKWIGKFDGGWQAAWPDYGLAVYTLSWEQLATPLVKIAPDGNLSTLSTTPWTSIPTWSHNSLWQYSSRIKPPYTAGTLYSHTYDWSVYYGSVGDMLAWVNKTPPQPPQEGYTDKEKLDKLWAAHPELH